MAWLAVWQHYVLLYFLGRQRVSYEKWIFGFLQSFPYEVPLRGRLCEEISSDETLSFCHVFLQMISSLVVWIIFLTISKYGNGEPCWRFANLLLITASPPQLSLLSTNNISFPRPAAILLQKRQWQNLWNLFRSAILRSATMWPFLPVN